jgi:acyl-coenzyme A synthetase/AMP-(fatty) acid ligase
VLGSSPDLLEAIPLRQITIGGEPVDQPLLDLLAQVYPEARITHIYATTETGRCIAVSDGRAGFPAACLDADASVEMTMDDSELLVRRAGRAEWTRTGDLVRLEGDRVLFDGRADDVLNVGGQKVAPVQVENVIRQLPGVADVRVYGRRSSLAGQIVACEIVPAPGTDPDALRSAVDAWARSNLPPAQQPRIVDIVDSLGMSPAGKIIRPGGTRR